MRSTAGLAARSVRRRLRLLALELVDSLDEADLDVGQCLDQCRLAIAESSLEPLDEYAERIDGETSLDEIGILGRDVKRCELVDAECVVGDDRCHLGLEKLLACLGHFMGHLPGLFLLFLGEVVSRCRTGRWDGVFAVRSPKCHTEGNLAAGATLERSEKKRARSPTVSSSGFVPVVR